MYEIERSFLLSQMPEIPSKVIVLSRAIFIQHYLQDCFPIVRLRKERLEKGTVRYLMTIKTGQGIKRAESNIEITKMIFSAMLLATTKKVTLEKIRVTVKDEFGQDWEIDHFQRNLQGLFRAEIELENETQEVQIPGWLKNVIEREITDDPSMSNYALACK